MAIAPLLESAGGSLSMFDVEAGTSFFGNLLGKQVANPIVKIADDGTLPNGAGSSPFDAEGVPTQKNIAIDSGILKTYLYNTTLARKYKTKTTANAGIISPQPHNIIIEGGKSSKEKLFSQVENGLYITNIWYTRFQNYTTGDFSTIPRDGIFLIKRGQIVKPVKQLRISENMLNLLKNISGIANDVQQITSWEVHTPVFTPHILVKDVNITEPAS
jgi:PmbA protein